MRVPELKVSALIPKAQDLACGHSSASTHWESIYRINLFATDLLQ
jgi:hypothetical protein